MGFAFFNLKLLAASSPDSSRYASGIVRGLIKDPHLHVFYDGKASIFSKYCIFADLEGQEEFFGIPTSDKFEELSTHLTLLVNDVEL